MKEFKELGEFFTTEEIEAVVKVVMNSINEIEESKDLTTEEYEAMVFLLTGQTLERILKGE